MTATSGDGLSATSELAYTVGAAKVTCTGNSGKVNYSPGVTGTGAVQLVKVKGTLSGCSGGPYTGAKYTGTLKTAGPVSCATLDSAGAPASGALIVKWTPKAKGADSIGTLLVLVSEGAAKAVGGALESGPFLGSIIAGSISQTFKNASACGVETPTKAGKPVKSATFTGTTVSVY